MPSEFTLDLCFIRERTQSPFNTIIEQQMSELFAGKGTWYVDLRVVCLLNRAAGIISKDIK